ncbi:MAG: twin-arginine translocase TatA/TatE family subunit [Conexibacter sp.]
MFSQFGPLEIVLVIVVLLVIFGPKRLPSLGRQLGSGMREFKDSITGDRKQDDEPSSDGETPPALAQAQAQEPAPASAERVDAASEQRG